MGLLSGINKMKVLGGVGKFIDESFLSKEEVQTAITEHYKATLQETTPRSITRRYIAVSIVAVFLLLIVAAVIAYPLNKVYGEFVFSIVEEIFGIVLTIVIFYFGGYYGGKFISQKTAKEPKK